MRAAAGDMHYTRYRSLLGALALLLLLINALTVAQVLNERYFGTFDEDSIVYHVISIPFNAYNLKIRVWMEELPTRSHISENPTLILKYDGLPTLSSRDGAFSIPQHPQSLLISDPRPEMAQLYIGIWGGKLLHSNRYFAGSPSSTAFGIEATSMICEGVFNANECHPHVILPLTVISSSKREMIPVSVPGLDVVDASPFRTGMATKRVLQQRLSSSVGSSFVYTLSIPSRMELLTLTVFLDSFQVLSICHTSGTAEFNATKRLFIQLYRDEDDNELDEGSEYLDFSCPVSCTLNHDDAQNCHPVELQMAVEFPVVGYWNLYVDLSYKPIVDNSINGKQPPFQRAHQTNRHEEMNSRKATATFSSEVIDSALTSNEADANEKCSFRRKLQKGSTFGGEHVFIDIEIVGYSCSAGRTGYSDVMNYMKRAENGHVGAALVNCLSVVGDLTRLQSTDSAKNGFVVYSSTRDGTIGWPAGSSENNALLPVSEAFVDHRNLTTLRTSRHSFALFSITAEPTSGNFPVGGYMEVNLRVRSPSPVADKRSPVAPPKKPFVIAVRCGGIASDPFRVKWGTGNQMGSLHLSKPAEEGSVGYAGRFSENGIVLITSQATRSLVERIDADTIKENDADGSIWWNPFEDKQSGWFNTVASWFSQFGGGNITQIEKYQNSSRYFDVVQYTWLISKPTLPNINSGHISVRVVPVPTAPSAFRAEFQAEEALSDEVSLLSMSVTFMPCSKLSCAHGLCVSQKGSITASTCVCRYPWAGERCTDLSISHTAYVVEVTLKHVLLS
jgi:hypothetical protein